MPAAIPAVIGAAGAIGGALINKKSAKDAAEAANQPAKMDPRLEQILFGSGPGTGLLGQFQGLLNAPRSDAANAFAGANASYLTQNGGGDLASVRDAAIKSMNGNTAPQAAGVQQAAPEQISNPAFMQGNMVQAPSQNGLDLKGSFDSLINGPAGANPYLTGAIQKGINQSTNAFGNMVTDAKAATQDVLANIRGNSVLAGQYGGSRQGIAEGKAIESMNTNLARAASQFGQNNTDAAVAAQAGAYDADRNRQLAATQGLSGQQYATAFKDTDTRNMAELTNVNMVNDLLKTNTGLRQQTNIANADRAQQDNQFNAGMQLNTNAQNNASGLAGAGLLSGQLGQVAGTVNANDNWKLGQAQGVNSLLAPYLAGAPVQQQVSSNSGAAALGGGLAGLSLGNSLAGMFGNLGGGTTGGLGGSSAIPAGGLPAGWAPSQLPVQSFPMFTNFSSS